MRAGSPAARTDGPDSDDAASARARLATLRELRGPVAGSPSMVRELVVLASSSRGGSSMVAETLRSSHHLLHLSAEMNPFLRLVGLAHPASGTGSDRLDASQLDALDPVARQVLEDELVLDTGRPAPPGTAGPDDDLALDAVWRLVLQWPELPLDPAECLELARAVLRRDRAAWSGPNPRRLLLGLLEELRRRGLPVHPGWYDLRGPELPEGWTDRPPGPPGGTLLEEPPFVLPRPWRRATPADLADKPLVVKTPSNAYRFGFLRALFPQARLRVVHLVRNPAASINGLYDGWRSGAFHAHRMPAPLRIRGYADARPEDADWWKFDLPPGWPEYTSAGLMEVCAFQWRSCHRAILDEVDGTGVDHIRIRAEDVMGGPQRRAESFRALAEWLGIPFDRGLAQATQRGVPLVAATQRPSPGRWRMRAEQVEAALDPAVESMARRLGCADSARWS